MDRCFGDEGRLIEGRAGFGCEAGTQCVGKPGGVWPLIRACCRAGPRRTLAQQLLERRCRSAEDRTCISARRWNWDVPANQIEISDGGAQLCCQRGLSGVAVAQRMHKVRIRHRSDARLLDETASQSQGRFGLGRGGTYLCQAGAACHVKFVGKRVQKVNQRLGETRESLLRIYRRVDLKAELRGNAANGLRKFGAVQ